MDVTTIRVIAGLVVLVVLPLSNTAVLEDFLQGWLLRLAVLVYACSPCQFNRALLHGVFEMENPTTFKLTDGNAPFLLKNHTVPLPTFRLLTRDRQHGK